MNILLASYVCSDMARVRSGEEKWEGGGSGLCMHSGSESDSMIENLAAE